MNLIRIDNHDDPRVAPYLDIRERDLAGRQGRFVAEGKVVLSALLGARHHHAESVLVLENRLAGVEALLRTAPDGLPVYVAAQDVLDRIAGFHIHRGILAIGVRPAPVDVEQLVAALPSRATVLALIGISNHDNVGSIFRNAAAFGADAVLLDPTCCDPLYRKAIRVSVGAIFKVPYAVCDNAMALDATLARAGVQAFGLSPGGALDIRDVARPERVALYLGTEGAGLPDKVLKRMQTMRISMADGFDSLNVAAASAIALHHFSAAAGPAPPRR